MLPKHFPSYPRNTHRPLGESYLVSLNDVLNLEEHITIDGEQFERVGQVEGKTHRRHQNMVSAYGPFTNSLSVYVRQLNSLTTDGLITPIDSRLCKGAIVGGHEIGGHYHLERLNRIRILDSLVQRPMDILFLDAQVLASRLISGSMNFLGSQVTSELYSLFKFMEYGKGTRNQTVEDLFLGIISSLKKKRKAERPDEHSIAATLLEGPYAEAVKQFCREFLPDIAGMLELQRISGESLAFPVALDDFTLPALTELKREGTLDIEKLTKNEVDLRRSSVDPTLKLFSPIIRGRADVESARNATFSVLGDEDTRRLYQRNRFWFARACSSRLDVPNVEKLFPLLEHRLTVLVIEESGLVLKGSYFNKKILQRQGELRASILPIVKSIIRLEETYLNALYDLVQLGQSARIPHYQKLLAASENGDNLPYVRYPSLQAEVALESAHSVTPSSDVVQGIVKSAKKVLSQATHDSP